MDSTSEVKGGFFSFRTMISTSVIKILYVLGMIGITIAGIGFILFDGKSPFVIGNNVVSGIV